MFIFKKIISAFLFPLSLSLSLLSAGLFLLWFSRKEKTGKIIITISFSLLLFFSSKISNLLLRPLENKYPPYSQEYSVSVKPEFVIVLGGGHRSDPGLPLTSKTGAASLTRLMEGIRIYREIPGSKLILSGGEVFDTKVSDAGIMAQVARSIGVEGKDIMLESESRDTEEEAIILKPILGNKPFVLVTSASHMPRSVGLFKKLGMNPIPAPTEHLVSGKEPLSPGLFFPSLGNISKAHRAIYEYLGICWAKLRGEI